jgi:hypothetical protein
MRSSATVVPNATKNSNQSLKNTTIMARPDYVPRKHADLDSWQRNLNTMVSTNATAWAIPATLVTELNDRSSTFGALYKPVENRETRTPQQVAAFNQFRISYTAFLRQLVQGYLVNNPVIPYDEKIAMGLNPRTGSRSSRPSIKATPVIELTNGTGGVVYFDCRNSEDGRSARPDNADGVELHIEIEGMKVADSLIDVEEPTMAQLDNKLTLRSSKSRFKHAFGLENRGKQFTVYGKYYNNSDSTKNGEVGSMVTGYIV